MRDCFEHARQVADAVLYEGYLLYPYRVTAPKNRVRWQFGVVAPREWSEAGGCESSWMQLECLIRPGPRPTLIGIIRFLQVQRRIVEQALDPAGVSFRRTDALEVDGDLWTSWDEGVEREIHLHLTGDLHPGIQRAVPFALEAGRDIEPIATAAGRPVGRLVRERLPIRAELRFLVEEVAAPQPLLRLRVRIDNVTPAPKPGASREEALRSSLVGAHLLLAVEGGNFVSLLDPPDWAQPAAASCVNVRSWPVLTDAPEGHDVILAAPIILYDHPQVAPESPAELHDATEIDELLVLRTMTMTDEEKRQARATDPRAAELLDRIERMTPDDLARLHGAIRYLRPLDHGPPLEGDGEDDRVLDFERPLGTGATAPPWWNPAADRAVAPETDSVQVDGVAVARGSHVRLRPGRRRADAQDMFLVDRLATVQGVFLDIEDQHYVAVTLVDDPGADLQQAQGRYLYFYPDEIEPIEDIH